MNQKQHFTSKKALFFIYNNRVKDKCNSFFIFEKKRVVKELNFYMCPFLSNCLIKWRNATAKIMKL